MNSSLAKVLVKYNTTAVKSSQPNRLNSDTLQKTAIWQALETLFTYTQML